MAVLKVTKENFAEVANSTKPVLLDFYATWCGPCKMVSPLVDQIADEHSEFTVGKINVDEQPELAAALGSERPRSVMLSSSMLVTEHNGQPRLSPHLLYIY